MFNTDWTITTDAASAAESVSVQNAGDYRLRVTPGEPAEECDGYVVTVYGEKLDENGQVVYEQVDNMSSSSFDNDDELIVGGRYDYAPDETETDETESEPPEFIGLEPGKRYMVGLCRVNNITDDDGNVISTVMSEETFSDIIELSQPSPPTITASVAAADGTPADKLSAGTVGGNNVTVPTVASRDVNITLTSDMPVSGSWYLNSTSYDDAKAAAEEGGTTSAFGEFDTAGGNTAVITLSGLETQGHTPHIDGTNNGGDGFSETINFAVDTTAPTLVLNEPVSGSMTEDNKITISGRTDPNATLIVEVNDIEAGRKTASEWDGASDDGSFEFTVPADENVMKNKVTVTAVDAIGNTTSKTVRAVNEKISSLTGVRLYFNGTDVTNTRMDSSSEASGTLELYGITKNNDQFLINDDSSLVWNLVAVEGGGSIIEDSDDESMNHMTGSMLFYDKYSRGMVTGMFRLTDTAGFTAAASYGIENTHQVTFDVPENAQLTVEPSNAAAGDTVTVTVTPDTYYIVEGLESNAEGVTFEKTGDLSFTFTMPDDDIHITAVITRDPAAPTPEPTKRPSSSGGGSSRPRPTATPTPSPTTEPTVTPEPSDIDKWFEDVPEDKWYYEPIKYAYDNGLMNGVSDTLFAPETDITRGMFVTVLHRMEGTPVPSEAYTFTDVPQDSYYSEAVAWASENGTLSSLSDKARKNKKIKQKN